MVRQQATRLVVAAVLLVAAGCSDDDKPSDGLPAINGPAVVETTTTVAGTPDTVEPTSTDVEATDAPTTNAPTTLPAATTTFPPYTSAVYSDPSAWLCRPETVDVCDEPMPVTEVAPDGTLTARPYTVAADPPLDCFYVYPTISTDQTFNSDFDVSNGGEAAAAQRQVASFNQLCTVYAPIYRSVTLAGLFGSVPGNFVSGWRAAYEDVRDAWKSYLANDNHRRPVVIIAHSQGSFHVTTLLN